MAKKKDSADEKDVNKPSKKEVKSAKDSKGSKDAKASKKDNGKAKKKKGGIRKYFRELKAELKKVTWPSRKQVVRNTGVVLSVMIVMALFLFGVDSGLGAAIQAILNIGS